MNTTRSNCRVFSRCSWLVTEPCLSIKRPESEWACCVHASSDYCLDLSLFVPGGASVMFIVLSEREICERFVFLITGRLCCGWWDSCTAYCMCVCSAVLILYSAVVRKLLQDLHFKYDVHCQRTVLFVFSQFLLLIVKVWRLWNGWRFVCVCVCGWLCICEDCEMVGGFVYVFVIRRMSSVFAPLICCVCSRIVCVCTLTRERGR
jgi:hypothetical protein